MLFNVIQRDILVLWPVSPRQWDDVIWPQLSWSTAFQTMVFHSEHTKP